MLEEHGYMPEERGYMPEEHGYMEREKTMNSGARLPRSPSATPHGQRTHFARTNSLPNFSQGTSYIVCHTSHLLRIQ
jgi:hypothetical protein